MVDAMADNWRMFIGIVTGAFISGIVVVVYLREGLRKWLISGDGEIGRPCPLVEARRTPLSREEHEDMCKEEWAEHNKMSAERWLHNQEIAAKNRELLLSEIDHLKTGQEKMSITVEKIFDRLDRRLP